jgi:hypothetical protein
MVYNTLFFARSSTNPQLNEQCLFQVFCCCREILKDRNNLEAFVFLWTKNGSTGRICRFLSVICISNNVTLLFVSEPKPAAVLCKESYCGLSLTGIAVSNPAGSCLSVVIVLCCQSEVSATGRLLVKRSPTECGVSECDRRTSQKKPRSTRALEPWKTDKVRRRSQAGSGTEFMRRQSWTLRTNHPYHQWWENHENLVGAYWWSGEKFWIKYF